MVKAVVRLHNNIVAKPMVERLNVIVRDVSVNLQGYPYNGPYEVIPDENEHLLPTSGKMLSHNIIVHEIPIAIAERLEIDRIF